MFNFKTLVEIFFYKNQGMILYFQFTQNIIDDIIKEYNLTMKDLYECKNVNNNTYNSYMLVEKTTGWKDFEVYMIDRGLKTPLEFYNGTKINSINEFLFVASLPKLNKNFYLLDSGMVSGIPTYGIFADKVFGDDTQQKFKLVFENRNFIEKTNGRKNFDRFYDEIFKNNFTTRNSYNRESPTTESNQKNNLENFKAALECECELCNDSHNKRNNKQINFESQDLYSIEDIISYLNSL